MNTFFLKIGKSFKVIFIFILVLISLIVLLFVIAKIKEKEIADIALKKVGESTHIPVNISDISLNLIRRFPMATIELKGISIGSPDKLISDKDSLVKIERAYVSVKVRPLLKGEFEIRKVEIKGVYFSYMVNRYGKSNFDFLKDTTRNKTPDTSAISLNLMLKELSLKDLHCNYHDSMNEMSSQIFIPKIELNGAIKDEYLKGLVKGKLQLSDCKYKATKLYLMKELEVNFYLAYSEDTVDIKDLRFLTDGADIHMIGNAIFKDTIKTDIQIQESEIIIGKLIKYIPDRILEKSGLQKASGKLMVDGTVKGPIANTIQPEMIMNVEMKNGMALLKTYPLFKNISFSGKLTNRRLKNKKTTYCTFSSFHAETPKSYFDLSGSIRNLNHIQYEVSSDMQIDLEEIKPFIPDTLNVDTRGMLSIGITTKGLLPDSVDKKFIDQALQSSQLDMTISNLFIAMDSNLILENLSGKLLYDLHHITACDFKVRIPKYAINVTQTSFDATLSGKISEPAGAGIDIKSYQIKTDSCVIYGSAKIINLKEPELSTSNDIKLNLKEIKPIMDTLVNDISGIMNAKIAFHGKLYSDSISKQLKEEIFKNSIIHLNFYKVYVNMPDTSMNIKALSGDILKNSDTLKINQTKGIYRDIDFNIDSTTVVNLYKSMIRKQKTQLAVDGRIKLGDLDYAIFAPFIEDTVKSTENKSKSALEYDSVISIRNFTYSIKGKLEIRSFSYKEANIKNISALFNFSDSLYLVDQLIFKGFWGMHNTSLRYEKRKEGDNMLWVKNSIDKMNIHNLLKKFNNFKEYYEPVITFNNVTGFLSSNIDAQIYFKGDSMIREKMYLFGDIKLNKGVIYHYPPLKDFEEVLPEIGNLDILEFETIKSSIFILQDTVYVPATAIVSNRFDAAALGVHSFNNYSSYHFLVFLSDLLSGKKEGKRQEILDKGGDIMYSSDSGGKRVKRVCENGKCKTWFDNRDNQKKMRDNIKTSQVLLKLRFHPYIVSYDTGVK